MEVFKSVLKRIGICLLITAVIASIYASALYINKHSEIAFAGPGGGGSLDRLVSFLLSLVAAPSLLFFAFLVVLSYIIPLALVSEIFSKKGFLGESSMGTNMYEGFWDLIEESGWKFMLYSLLSLIAWLLYNISFQLNTLIEISK